MTFYIELIFYRRKKTGVPMFAVAQKIETAISTKDFNHLKQPLKQVIFCGLVATFAQMNKHEMANILQTH
jgi:hypothetical protein